MLQSKNIDQSNKESIDSLRNYYIISRQHRNLMNKYNSLLKKRNCMKPIESKNQLTDQRKNSNTKKKIVEVCQTNSSHNSPISINTSSIQQANQYNSTHLSNVENDEQPIRQLIDDDIPDDYYVDDWQ